MLQSTGLKRSLPFLVIAALFVIWAAAFIYRSSFVAIDGHRYFSLADDAMISMRYAWNLSHGAGLVWNVGERVEGYSNLLMVLIMALVTTFFHRSAAVLVMQVAGIPVMLIAAWLTARIFRVIAGEVRLAETRFAEAAVFAAVLAYYPLAFWSLLGMETGLLAALLTGAVLCSLLYLERDEPCLFLLSCVLLGLAFLTRNDALIYAAVLLGYVGWRLLARPLGRRLWFAGLAILLAFVAAQEGFRYFYYGAWVPNTYTLKLVGMPLLDRLRNGLGFVGPFLIQAGVLWLVGLATVLSCRRASLYYLFAFVLMSLAYQIYVGGDAWARWRMLAPTVPLLLVLFVLGCVRLVRLVLASARPRFLGLALCAILLVGVASADAKWLQEIVLRTRPGSDTTAVNEINVAIAINAVTQETATIGVFYAGIVPYYTGRKAIDFLGRSDPHIAQLPPDLSGRISWDGMYSVPGHNKYDLTYSIASLWPVSVEGFRWGSQDLTAWSKAYYVTVTYKTVVLYLLRGSPAVNWDRVQYVYSQAQGAAQTQIP